MNIIEEKLNRAVAALRELDFRVHSNYDFNTDPANVTKLVGDVFQENPEPYRSNAPFPDPENLDQPSAYRYIETRTGSTCVPTSELLTAWDMAHDALTNVAEAAKKCGHVDFAREAETIADSLEQRVTSLSNLAKA